MSSARCMARDLNNIWEVWHPYVISFGSAIILSRLPLDFATKLEEKGFSVSNLFGALSGFNTFGAGVMITIFVFTMAPAAGFIGKLEKLSLYKKFRRYTIEAAVCGVISGLISIPIYASSAQVLTEPPMRLLIIFASVFTIAFVFTAWRVLKIFYFWTSQ